MFTSIKCHNGGCKEFDSVGVGRDDLLFLLGDEPKETVTV